MQKTLQILVTSSAFLFFSCNNGNKTTPADENKGARMEALFTFAETDDPTVCDPNDIVASDCSGGDIYLTEKGNAVYTFYCCCGDTTTHLIGTYTVENNVIACTFGQEYAFREYCEECEQPVELDPNAGKVTSRKTLHVELVPVKCKSYSHRIDDAENKITYAVTKADRDETGAAAKRLRRINVLSEL